MTALGQAADATTRTRIATMIKDSMKFLDKQGPKLSELNKISLLSKSRAALKSTKCFEIIKNLQSGRITPFTTTALGKRVSYMWRQRKTKIPSFNEIGFGTWDIVVGPKLLTKGDISSNVLSKAKQLEHRFLTTNKQYQDIVGK